MTSIPVWTVSIGLLAAVLCLVVVTAETVAQVSGTSQDASASQSVDPLPPSEIAQVPGLMMQEAGIHFLTPFGFELTKVEVLSEHGPAQMILLEPQDGSYQGEMNSGFISLTVYSSDISAGQALRLVLEQLRETFSDSGGFRAAEHPMMIGGQSREGYRIEFQLVGVPLVGYLGAFRESPITIVAYLQGRASELEALDEIIPSVLDAVGVE